MTNKEAILILEQYIPKPSQGNGKSMLTLKLTEAILLAISALDEQINTQRPKGKWKQHIYCECFVGYSEECEPLYRDIVVYICPFCGKEINEHIEKYCPNCGAEMEE